MRILNNSLRITLVASFLLLPISQASSVVKIGVTCTKIGAFQKTSQGVLVCDVVKKKKIWRKSTRIELSLYNKEQSRLKAEAAQKIIDDAKAESDRLAQIAADQAAAEAKAAADKAAADAKAAADKAAADAKAAADKAAADAKAAADKAAADAKAAADKAAAEAAAVPSLIVGSLFSGADADDSNWRWIAVRVTNSSNTKVFSHHSFNVLVGDSSGGILDSTFEPNFPLLAPGQSVWYTTTQFKGGQASQIVFQKQYSTSPSPLSAAELPTASNARLITSPYLPTRKSVQVTVRNNSSQVLSSSSTAYAVLLDSVGNPVYSARGFFDKAILPGGSAEIVIGDDFTFNGSVASIQVTIAPLLQR